MQSDSHDDFKREVGAQDGSIRIETLLEEADAPNERGTLVKKS